MVENPEINSTSLAFYTKTYYLRDAQGNIMATYERKYLSTDPDVLMTFSLTERSVYGSSRIANFSEPILLVSFDETTDSDYVHYGSPQILSHTNGYKHFELTNHLGNVMAVVSDKRTPIIIGSEITGYTPELLIAKDYYPFGMEMSGRYGGANGTEPDDEYRFGFQGQEKDDEWTGQTGSVYTAMFWEYDARIGRRWNLDPKSNPSISSYATFADNPIFYCDPYGDSLKTKISRSYRKELGLTRKDAKNYTPEKVVKTFEQEYGMNVEVRNGYLHYTGESTNKPSAYSPTAKEMWIDELDDDYKSKEKLVLTNKGYDHNSFYKTSYINLSNYDDNLMDLTSSYFNPDDINLQRTWNLGRIFEHEILGHSVMKYKDFTTAIKYQDVNAFREYKYGKKTALKLVNDFRIEIGLQDYQRLNYGQRVNDGHVVIFGNPIIFEKPTIPLKPFSFISY